MTTVGDARGVLDKLGADELAVLEALGERGPAGDARLAAASGLTVSGARMAATNLVGLHLATYDDGSDVYELDPAGLDMLLKAVEETSDDA